MNLKLIVTIDVEEDNWGEFHPTRYTLENLRRIPGLQQLFDEFGVRPTYLINYPVANDSQAVEMFGRYHAEGKCEIGMHCHPWNTPPYLETADAFHSMLSNLPEPLQFRKLQVLKETIVRNLGVEPVSFRAGRWAFGRGVARALARLGFLIDSSVTPYMDWSPWHGVDYGSMSPGLYRFNSEAVLSADRAGELLQVPVTIGYLQGNFDRCNRIYQRLEGRCWRTLRVRALLDTLQLLNRVVFSPEVSRDWEMIWLAKVIREQGYPVLNLFFHSNSLLPGCGPFVRTESQERYFFRTLRNLLAYTRQAGIGSILLREAICCVEPPWERYPAGCQTERLSADPPGLAAS